MFAEHEKLKVENPLLKEKIFLLEELNNMYVISDSLRTEQVNILLDTIISNLKKIKKLKLSRNLSCAGGIILFIIGLII